MGGLWAWPIVGMAPGAWGWGVGDRKGWPTEKVQEIICGTRVLGGGDEQVRGFLIATDRKGTWVCVCVYVVK